MNKLIYKMKKAIVTMISQGKGEVTSCSALRLTFADFKRQMKTDKAFADAVAKAHADRLARLEALVVESRKSPETTTAATGFEPNSDRWLVRSRGSSPTVVGDD
jgi:hypothetical protein